MSTSTPTPTRVTSATAVITCSLTTPAGTPLVWPAWVQTFATYQGGDPSVSAGELFPGGIENGSEPVPGPRTRSDVVVELPYSTDLDAMRSSIEACLNKQGTAGYTTTDGDGNLNGEPVTRTGIATGLEFPQYDAKSGDPQYLKITIKPRFQ